jgi:phosphoserine phosphatase
MSTASLLRDPLPSWNQGAVKSSILSFVQRVTDPTSPDYVPPAERIATFDNDGTLWCEYPLLVQLHFLIDRVATIVAQQPELGQQQPFKALLEKDKATLATFTKKELMTLVFATHTGMPSEEFKAIARDWLNAAKHPQLQRLFTQCVYQPQLELLAYLQAQEFKTYIVSGGGVEFIRAFAEQTYGIPPEQVIGSSSKSQVEIRDGQPVLVKQAELGSFDDREEKVVNIDLHIGRRPLIAVGNSDGDLAMIQYTLAGDGPRLGLLLHHDDGDREYAYDRDFHLSPLNQALEDVPRLGGQIISMKQDFKQIFP